MRKFSSLNSFPAGKSEPSDWTPIDTPPAARSMTLRPGFAADGAMQHWLACAVVGRDVTALAHELGNDPVEYRALEVQRFAALVVGALFA